MADEKLILVTGATGHQGGAVARHLLKRGYRVRALTRDTGKPAARQLRENGAEVVAGNLDDADSLAKAVEGCYGVFSVQNFWETGYEKEVAQGKRLAEVAADAGVGHFVYSSVGGAERGTGIPHFDSKWEIEEHIHTLYLPVTVFRPVFFMDNWEADMLKNMVLGGVVYMPMSPETPFQQIAVDDIGFFVAEAFDKPEEWLGQEVEIAGDERAIEEVANTFSEFIGKEVAYTQVPWDDYERQAGHEYTVMFRWFEDEGYEADVVALREIHPDLQDFDTYLEKHGWREAVAAQ